MVAGQGTTASLRVVGSCLAVMFMPVCVSLAGTAKVENDSPSQFRVVWNYPDVSCVSSHIDLELSKYGIVANKPRTFVGNEVATLYTNFGLWPHYLNKDGTKNINGGIPQLANLTAHLDKLQKDIARQIPAGSTGYAAINQEIWRPLYDYNWGHYKIYKYSSIKEAKRKHGTKTSESVARDEWTKLARQFMEQSLMEARAVRPETHWGYYGYPPYWGSVYADGRLRAAYGHPNTPIVAYTIVQAGNFFSEDVLDYAIGLPAEMGVDAVIIWGSSDNFKPRPVEKCHGIKKYVHDVLGPYVSQLLNRFANCSISRCGGHGKCVKRDYAQIIAKSTLKQQAGPVNIDVDQGESTDRRQDGYSLTAGAPSNGNIKRVSSQSNRKQSNTLQVDAVRGLDHSGSQSSQNTTSKLLLNSTTGSINKNVSSSHSETKTTAIVGNLPRKGFNVQYTGHNLRNKLIDVYNYYVNLTHKRNDTSSVRSFKVQYRGHTLRDKFIDVYNYYVNLTHKQNDTSSVRGFKVQYTGHTLREKLINVYNYYVNLTHKQNDTTSVKFGQPKSSNIKATGLSLNNSLLLHNDSSIEEQKMPQKRATSQGDKSDSSIRLQTPDRSVDPNTANQTSTIDTVSTENNQLLGRAPVGVDTTVSHQYDDYVCQCYSQYKGTFCEETNSV